MGVSSPGVNEFTELSDTPHTYAGSGSKTVAVNSGATALEFVTGGGGAVDSVNGQTGVVVLDTGDITEATDFNYVSDAQLVVIGNTSGTNTGDNATNTQYSGLATSKQDTLVSGTNIKTINSNSLLGSGDLAIGGGDVTKVGTPANDQIGVWTGDGTIEGDAALTFDTTTNTLTTGNITANEGYILSSATTPYVDLYETDTVKYGGMYMTAGNLNLYTDTGNIRLNADLDMNFNSFIGSVFTDADNLYNLGSSTNGWANIYLSNNAPINWANQALLTNYSTTGIRVGGGAAPGVISSVSTYDLILQTGNVGATTGNITIIDGANGNITLNPHGSGKVVASTDVEVPDEVYGVGWNASLEVPTKNALYDKIDTMDSAIALNTAKVTNATHTGDATGATALTVVKIQGKDFPTLSAADDQKYPKYVSASNAFVMTALAGGGNVSNTGTPANNQIAVWTDATTVEGDSALTFDTTTDKLSAGGTTGSVDTGTIELGHASDTTLSRSAAGVLAVEGVPIIKATSGVGATPTASGTTAITHGLGRIPSIIRIYSGSGFTSNAAATPTTYSMGMYTSSGNTCIYQGINGTTTIAAASSTAFAVYMITSAGNLISGVIQNVGATTFDIVWTETGTQTRGVYMWEAQ